MREHRLATALIVAALVAVTVCALPMDGADADPVTVSDIDDLNDAIDDAEGETVISLGDDITGSITIPEGKTIVLDLNGHTIQNAESAEDSSVADGTRKHTITNNGTLIIIDSSSEGTGKVDNLSHGRSAIYNNPGGTVTLNGGTYLRSAENGQNADDNGGNSYYTILNHGTMYVNEGVSVYNEGKYSSMFENGWQNGSQNTEGIASTLVINGGYFSGGLNTIKNDDYGNLTIDGGTFENMVQSALLNWNVCEINGGSFTLTSTTASVILNGHNDDTMDKGELTINGGEFTGTVGIQMMGGSQGIGTVNITGGTFDTQTVFNPLSGTQKSISVSGGTFSAAFNASYLVGGYKDLVQVDGMYVPSCPEEDAVASIGDVYHPSLKLAINAAGIGDRIVLQEDVTGSFTIPFGKDLTLDLAGHTIQNVSTAGAAGDHTITVGYGASLTIMDSVGGGKVDNLTNAKGAVVNHGTFTLVSGTLTRSAEASKGPTDSGGNSWYVVENHGTMTVEGGSIHMNGRFSSLVRNIGSEDSPAVLTVNGGELSNGFIAVKNDKFGILSITGGDITSQEQSVQNWGHASITGGTLTGNVASWSDENQELYAVTMHIGGDAYIDGDVISTAYTDSKEDLGSMAIPLTEIDGGTVTGDILTRYGNESGKYKPLPEEGDTDDYAWTQVSGGTFIRGVEDRFLADGYALVENPDGSYSVMDEDDIVPDRPTFIPGDRDDDDPVVPPLTVETSESDDTIKVAAVAAAAVAAAIIALFLVFDIRRSR